jgi:hypothetical protein
MFWVPVVTFWQTAAGLMEKLAATLLRRSGGMLGSFRQRRTNARRLAW